MPVVTCPHCHCPVQLPDPWAAEGYTCPHCHRPAQLPRMIGAPYPPPIYHPTAYHPVQVVPPPPPPTEPTVVEHHTYDHTPRRSAFATGFGGSFGCMLGGAFGVFAILLCFVLLLVVPATCVKIKEHERRTKERQEQQRDQDGR